MRKWEYSGTAELPVVKIAPNGRKENKRGGRGYRDRKCCREHLKKMKREERDRLPLGSTCDENKDWWRK